MIPFLFFENFKFFLRRAQAARGPYFLLLQKVGKDRRKGVSPPCGSPDQSGVLDAPLWKPPSLAALSGLAELLAACAAGASVPLGKAASACALATIAAPPPLRLGASPPGPPRSQTGTFACHARRRMVPRSNKAFAGNATQICAEALRREAAAGSALPSRGCAEGTLARPKGESQRGRSPLWPVFAYFLLARK